MAHYVDNKEFLKAITEYHTLAVAAKENGAEKPRVSNYIGDCIVKIATHLSYKPNFINYSYRDEMILDAVENCIQYVGNFNPERSSNPFSYFTQISYFAFLRRISKEKKQSYIRSKLIREMPFDSFDTQDHEDDGAFQNMYLEFIQSHQSDDSYYDKKVAEAAARKKKPKNALTAFIESEELAAEPPLDDNED